MLYSIIKPDGGPRRNSIGLPALCTRLQVARSIAHPGDRILQIASSGHIRRTLEVTERGTLRSLPTPQQLRDAEREARRS